MEEDYFKGRGAQIRSDNKFLKAQYVTEHVEGLDEPAAYRANHRRSFMRRRKNIVNKVTSSDLGMMYSAESVPGL